MATETPKYTTVLHDVRIFLGLSVLEYCVADTINRLSTNTNSKIPGWCYAGKEFLGEGLGISRQHIHRIINRLISIGIVEKDEETKYLRTTQIWYNNVVIIDSKQSLQGVTKCDTVSQDVTCNKMLQGGCNKRLHNNNNIDNNKEEEEELKLPLARGLKKKTRGNSINKVLSDALKTIAPEPILGKTPFDVELDKGYDGIPKEVELPVKKKKEKKKQTRNKDPLKIEESKAISEIIGLFGQVNDMIKNDSKTFYRRTTQREAIGYLFKHYGITGAVELAKKAIEYHGQKGAPIITTPLRLKERLADLNIFIKRQEEIKPKGNKTVIGKDFSKNGGK